MLKPSQTTQHLSLPRTFAGVQLVFLLSLANLSNSQAGSLFWDISFADLPLTKLQTLLPKEAAAVYEETVERVTQGHSYRLEVPSLPHFLIQVIAEGLSGVLADGGLLDGNTGICPGIWSVSPELWGQDLSPFLCLLLLLLLLLFFLQQPCGVGIISVSLQLR